tara:strand:+ start:530 stop:721 length:192 start_codon:yes stop_codon:yes gene_type:complete
MALFNDKVSITRQITLIEEKIRVLEELEEVKMLAVVKKRIPVYKAILKTLKLVKRQKNVKPGD